MWKNHSSIPHPRALVHGQREDWSGHQGCPRQGSRSEEQGSVSQEHLFQHPGTYLMPGGAGGGASSLDAPPHCPPLVVLQFYHSHHGHREDPSGSPGVRFNRFNAGGWLMNLWCMLSRWKNFRKTLMTTNLGRESQPNLFYDTTRNFWQKNAGNQRSQAAEHRWRQQSCGRLPLSCSHTRCKDGFVGGAMIPPAASGIPLSHCLRRMKVHCPCLKIRYFICGTLSQFYQKLYFWIKQLLSLF